MINYLRSFAERTFPERQVLLRSGSTVRHLTVRGWVQAALVSTSLTTLGAMGYLTAGYFHAHHVIREKQAEVASAQLSQADVAALVADLRRQLDGANEQYAAARDQLAVATSENGALQSSVKLAESRAKSAETARNDLERRLRAAEQTLNDRTSSTSKLAAEERRAEQARADMQGRLQQLESQLQAANAKVKELKLALDGRDKQLSSARDRAGTEQANRQQLAQAAAEPSAVAAPAAPTPAPVRHTGAAAELERLIASTGINLDALLGHLGSAPPAGQGGPYIALKDARTASPEEQHRIAEIESLVKTLPLGTPLAHYTLESGFGRRTDPFRGKQAFHDGVDLAAPYKTPVYATGPGVVVFTGVKTAYGRVVEVDHGHGIVTRYAHLHRILVAKGQKVGPHTEIGQLGSTGRSTGPHVHYEVLVDGVPQDPEKFMEVGKNVIQVSKK